MFLNLTFMYTLSVYSLKNIIKKFIEFLILAHTTIYMLYLLYLKCKSVSITTLLEKLVII